MVLARLWHTRDFTGHCSELWKRYGRVCVKASKNLPICQTLVPVWPLGHNNLSATQKDTVVIVEVRRVSDLVSSNLDSGWRLPGE